MPDSSPLERQLANIFAMTIRARRKELGLSQEQVALRADIDRNHYQLMESARSDRRSNKAVNPRLFTLFRLANALELPVEDLLLAASETFQEQVEAGETGGNSAPFRVVQAFLEPPKKLCRPRRRRSGDRCGFVVFRSSRSRCGAIVELPLIKADIGLAPLPEAAVEVGCRRPNRSVRWVLICLGACFPAWCADNSGRGPEPRLLRRLYASYLAVRSVLFYRLNTPI